MTYLRTSYLDEVSVFGYSQVRKPVGSYYNIEINDESSSPYFK